MSLLDSYAPSAKFPTRGTRVGGRVVRDAVEQQQRDFDSGEPLTWDDGKPRMQLIITVDTGEVDPSIEDDDGERSIYVKGQMLAATRQACRKAKVREIAEGGTFFVTYVDDEPLPKGKRGFPKKVYEVEYTPPAKAAEPAAVDQPARDPHQASLREAATQAARRSDETPPF